MATWIALVGFVTCEIVNWWSREKDQQDLLGVNWKPFLELP